MCASEQTRIPERATMGYVGDHRNYLQARLPTSLVRLEHYALDSFRRFGCPLAPWPGHLLHARGIHPHAFARGSGYLGD